MGHRIKQLTHFIRIHRVFKK